MKESTGIVTEIVKFSNFRINDAESAAFELVNKLDGCIRCYHGSKSSGGDGGMWLQNWVTLEHHKAFERSDIYPAFVSGVSAFAQVEDILHAQFDQDALYRIMETQYTEISIATLNVDTTNDTFKAEMEILLESAGLKGTSIFGTSLETPTKFVIIRGIFSEKESFTKLEDFNNFIRLRDMANFETRIYKPAKSS